MAVESGTRQETRRERRIRIDQRRRWLQSPERVSIQASKQQVRVAESTADKPMHERRSTAARRQTTCDRELVFSGYTTVMGWLVPIDDFWPALSTEVGDDNDVVLDVVDEPGDGFLRLLHEDEAMSLFAGLGQGCQVFTLR